MEAHTQLEVSISISMGFLKPGCYRTVGFSVVVRLQAHPSALGSCRGTGGEKTWVPQLRRGQVGDASPGSGAARDMFAMRDEGMGFLLIEV